MINYKYTKYLKRHLEYFDVSYTKNHHEIFSVHILLRVLLGPLIIVGNESAINFSIFITTVKQVIFVSCYIAAAAATADVVGSTMALVGYYN